jgi:hypothetical protein
VLVLSGRYMVVEEGELADRDDCSHEMGQRVAVEVLESRIEADRCADLKEVFEDLVRRMKDVRYVDQNVDDRDGTGGKEVQQVQRRDWENAEDMRSGWWVAVEEGVVEMSLVNFAIGEE